MSDFFSDAWSIFIAVTTIVSLIACLALLAFASRRQPMASDNSTGHVFDEDLVEMNNPLPLWWVVLFVITVLFGAGTEWLGLLHGHSTGRVSPSIWAPAK